MAVALIVAIFVLLIGLGLMVYVMYDTAQTLKKEKFDKAWDEAEPVTFVWDLPDEEGHMETHTPSTVTYPDPPKSKPSSGGVVDSQAAIRTANLTTIVGANNIISGI